jgi:hypothetical protein
MGYIWRKMRTKEEENNGEASARRRRKHSFRRMSTADVAEEEKINIS